MNLGTQYSKANVIYNTVKAESSTQKNDEKRSNEKYGNQSNLCTFNHWFYGLFLHDVTSLKTSAVEIRIKFKKGMYAI